MGEVLVGEFLVPPQRSCRRDCGAGDTGALSPQRSGSSPATGRTGRLGSCSARSGQGGVRGSVHRQMLRAGVPLLAPSCLYQTAPEMSEAELS